MPNDGVFYWLNQMPYKNKEDKKAWYEANKEERRACNKAYYEAHKEQTNARSKKWAKANPEKAVAKSRKWQKKNPAKHAANSKRWRQNNPEKASASAKKSRKKNPATYTAAHRRYNSASFNNTPTWAKTDQGKNLIQELFLKRDELNKQWNLTGKDKLQVDHIVPLQCPDVVCGLNCWDNLQLLSKSLNASKNNSYDPDNS